MEQPFQLTTLECHGVNRKVAKISFSQHPIGWLLSMIRAQKAMQTQ